MKVVKKTGLVPVISLKSTVRGIFGVTPEAARAGVLSGELGLAPVPAEVETFSVADPEMPKVITPPPSTDEPVEIPSNWAAHETKGFVDENGKQVHSLKRIALAEKIIGSAIAVSDEDKKAGIKRSDHADLIIREEIQRRAAAVAPAE